MNRINGIQELLKDNDAALILSPVNRFYLTGIKTSDGALFITRKTAYLLVDSRYYEIAYKNKDGFSVVLLTDFNSQISKAIADNNINSVIIETDYISIEKYKSLKEKLNCDIPDSSLLSDKLCELRAVKDDFEVESIIKAQEITDKTFDYILNEIKPGKTEKEIMLLMEYYSRSIGSSSPAFDFIVVSGKNSSLPHGVPTDKKIENGDFITIDFGATVNGYKSDMTRTVALSYVTKEQEKVYNTVLSAQTKAINNIFPGKVCSDIDKIARDYIKDNGYGNYFGHALGHSVGLDIHESPNFSPRSNNKLVSGNVMTVEPGIYIPDKFGVRIEDMIIITDNGYIDITKSKKELIVL